MGFVLATARLVAQTGGTEPLSPLANYGLVGALLGVMFWFMWFVISGYRKDMADLKAEIREANTYQRDKTVPIVMSNATALEANTTALREAAASNTAVVNAVAQLMARRDG